MPPFLLAETVFAQTWVHTSPCLLAETSFPVRGCGHEKSRGVLKWDSAAFCVSGGLGATGQGCFGAAASAGEVGNFGL